MCPEGRCHTDMTRFEFTAFPPKVRHSPEAQGRTIFDVRFVFSRSDMVRT